MKRLFFSSVLITCLILCLTVFSSCASEKSKFSAYSLDYFDTATTITGYEVSKQDFDKVSGEILSMLQEYHRLFDIYKRYDGLENICTINELVNGEHRVVKVDKKIVDLLTFAMNLHEVTDGYTNIALGSVLSIWHTYRTDGVNNPMAATLPPYEQLLEASQHVNIDNIVVDVKNCTVWISDPETTIDVGAVAKGYAVEMVARKLEENGITGYVINVGGNVRTIGTKPDGKSWVAGIENPDTSSDQSFIKYLALEGESVVTSGSYQRFYTVEGKRYHHIIDADTLMPAEGFMSVSVVCKDSGLADALSTALFCMDFEKGLSLVESLDDVEAMWVIDTGEQKMSSGFERYVTEI